MSLCVIIIEKNGLLKSYTIKQFNEAELYKKCGFKKAEGFTKHHDWNIKLDTKNYIISMYGKLDGKANMENKYDFPPPIDNKLFFGNCMLVGMLKEDTNKLVSLTIPLWEKIYEKLFGGFEELIEEEEEDELENISKSLKTKKGGYLKDDFVVDSDEEEFSESEDSSEEPFPIISEKEELIEDIGLELSEENYEYSDEEII